MALRRRRRSLLHFFSAASVGPRQALGFRHYQTLAPAAGGAGARLFPSMAHPPLARPTPHLGLGDYAAATIFLSFS